MPNAALSASSSSSRTAPHHIDKLWSAALETWCHQLLYTRGVYPKETFVKVCFQGVHCYANRHPDVVAYVRDSIQLAVPALQCGAANQISLLITCEDIKTDTLDDSTMETEETVTLEEYTIRVMSFPSTSRNARTVGIIASRAQELERSLRDLVLAVHAMPRREGFGYNNNNNKASLSFRLEVQLQDTALMPTSIQTELEKGKWHVPPHHQHHDGETKGHVVRPLYRADTPIGSLQFVQRRQTNKQTNKQKEQYNSNERGKHDEHGGRVG